MPERASSELTVVHTGIDFGEGPRWHDGRLWFSDFYRHGVYTLDADGTETKVASIAGQPSGLGWMPDGTLLVVSMRDHKLIAVSADGERREHADLSGLATGLCNDMVVNVDGTAFVGNFGFDLEADADFAVASLARVDPDGSVSEAAADLRFPNGAVITADGSTLIVGETFGGCYTAFDLESDGSLTNRRLWAAVEGMTPDGCCIDADDAIWVADIMNSRVLRILEGGEITNVIETPSQAVACALGGDDRRTLFIHVSPTATPDELQGRGLSSIVTTRVDVPGAGLP